MDSLIDYLSPDPDSLASTAVGPGTVLVTASGSAGVGENAPVTAAITFRGQSGIVRTQSTSDEPWEGLFAVLFDLPLNDEEPFFLLPSFIYGTNRAEQPVHEHAKQWPRLRRQTTEGGEPEPPFASSFTVRADRLTHPVAIVRAGWVAVGISGAPCPDQPATGVVAGFGCAWLADRARLIYTLGYENTPWLYAGSGIEHQSEPGSLLHLPPHATVEFEIEIHLVTADKRDDNRPLSQIVRSVYERYHTAPRRVSFEATEPPESAAGQFPQATALLAGALADHAWYEPAANYCTTVREKDGTVVQDTKSFSVSWTGGLAVAVPLLLAAQRMRRDTSALSRVRDWDAVHAQALRCVDHFIRSRNPSSGLPFDAFRDGAWTTRGWWEEYVWSLEGKQGHSSYLVGEALYYLLLAYEIEKTHSSPHPEWLVFAKQCLARAEQTISEEGEYPYIWSSQTGEGVEYDAQSGAWMTAARAYEYAIGGGEAVLASAHRTLCAYHEHVKRMLCYGAPHDTWKAPDQEGILGFIKAARLLHKATGVPYYLECLRDGLDYELTWQYCYNTRPQRPPLSTVGWSSCGGSVTSVANQCVHPMGLIVLDDLGWYAEQTGDVYYMERARDKVLWALQTFNRYDHEYDHGLAGWLSERFDATPILSIDTYPDGSPASTWFVGHPWGAGCLLEGLTGRLWRKEL